MAGGLSIAVTADLHWGHRNGREAARLLAGFVEERRPDVLVIAGDVGVGPQFEECLRLFAGFGGHKAVVPGNHDLWVPAEGAGHDSLDLFERLLPEAAARQGFHYLDRGPLVLPGAGLALVGTVNWYDYSWGIDGIRRLYPEEEYRLRDKRFTRGRHNDANFVRWPTDDAGFTALVSATLGRHLEEAVTKAERLVVVTHHPSVYALGFPREGPPVHLDSFLWDAFCGNAGVEQLLARYSSRIDYIFCGHTHRAREAAWQGSRGYNVGGDYHFKRLLWLEWPAGTVEAHEFWERE